MACLAKSIKCHYTFLFKIKLPFQQNIFWKPHRLLKTTAASCSGLRRRDRVPTLLEFKKRADYMREKGLWPDNRRSSFAEWDYAIEIYAFGRRLGEEFDESFLREAFVDNSYITQEKERLMLLGIEDPLPMKSNNELAESGRKIVTDFISKYLRSYWPLLPEEGVESVTQYLASTETFAKIGHGIGIKDLIMTQESPPAIDTCAACFSAIIGALHSSSGIEKTYKFIQDFILTQLVDKDIWDIWHIDEPMHMLKCILNGNGRGNPEPRLIGDIGRLTLEATFYVGIYSDKKLFGTGYGETIDMAIHVAALNSLSRLFNQTLSKNPLPIFQASEFILQSTANKSIAEWKIVNDIPL